MVTGKKLELYMRRELLRRCPKPLLHADRVTESTWRIAYRLVDHGYISGGGKISDLPDDLMQLGVWEGMIDWEGTADG